MPLSNFRIRPSIAVSDIGRAVDFYEGRLGLPVVQSVPSAEIADGARVYGSGGGALNVFQSATAGTSRATLATWYVDDIDLGHIVGIAVGAGCLALFGLTDRAPAPVGGLTAGCVATGALSVAVTTLLLTLSRCPHPPAGVLNPDRQPGHPHQCS